MPEIRHSVCALDCPDACSLLVTVDQSKGTRLRGNPDHPVTRGFLCGKVARYLEREYSPDRLLYPLRRVGAKGDGRFARITWDEALDEIADRLKSVAAEFGSAAEPDKEIKIGNTMPHSGPASAYGIIGKAESAYFNMLNEQGSINGRSVNFIGRLFVSTGADKWNDPKHFPWTMGWIPSYGAEASIYANYILANLPNAKIAVLY